MPKPGTVNTLSNPFSTPLTRLTQTGTVSVLPKPVMVNNLQTSGTTPLGTKIQPTATVKTGLVQPTTVTSKQPAQTSGTTQNLPLVNPNQSFNTMGGMQPIQTQQQQYPSYSGLIGQTPNFSNLENTLSGVSLQGSPVVNNLVQRLSDTNIQAQQLGQRAEDIANQYGKQIADVGQMGSQFQAGQLTTGTSPIATGAAAVTGQNIAKQQSALAEGEQAALQGIDKELAAQGLVQNAFNQAGGLANTGQAQRIAGLTSAAGLAQPQSYGITNTPYNPVEGTFGTMPGGGTGAFGAGVVQGNLDLGSQYATMNAANTAAKGIQSQIVSYLQDNPTLNPSDVAMGNAVLQWAQGQQLGDPKYQTLANLLNEYVSTLAPVLGVGGDTTNLKTQIAQSFINGRASGQSISEVLNAIGQIADAKTANIKSAATGGGQVAGGSMSSSGGSIWSW